MDSRSQRRQASLGKLSAPRRAHHFDRERLFALLDHMAAAPAVWIGAPPGAGKTTLAATWTQRRGDPALWLQVDAGDADPATLAGWLDTLWEAHAVRLAPLPAPSADDLGDFTGWLRRRLRRLLPVLPARWVLVFDNVHELPPGSPMLAALAGALDELPDGVHWVFISRDPPPPVFARQLARQQLLQLPAEALRLDEDETRSLIRLHGRNEEVLGELAPAQGWAAGITLMLLGPSATGRVPAPAAQERLFDYFADEVMARLPAHEHDALCQLACLPLASSDLARAMTGLTDSDALLERLAMSSFFVDRRNASRPVYVLHPLFRQFLLRRHERTADAESVRATRLHAGRLLLLAGDADSGLGGLIGAEAWDEAARAIADHAPSYLAQGRLLSLRRFIDALPNDRAAGLARWHGLCLIDTDPGQALVDAQSAFERAAASGDATEQLGAVALAMAALVALGRLPSLDRWIDALDPLQPVLELACDDATLAPSIVPGLVTALVFRRPWHPWTHALAERGERLLHRPGAPGQRLLLGSLSFYFLWQGEQERLARILARIDELCLDADAAPSALMRWWGVGTLIKTLIGHIESAAQDARRMLEMVAREPSVAHLQASAELQSCFVALGAGDPALARRHLDRGAAALDPDDAPNRTLAEHFHAMVALLEGDRSAALRLARAAVESGRRSGFIVREHIAMISHALAAACNGSHELAERLLDEVLSHPILPVCHWHRWIGNAVAAYAALLRDDEALALVRTHTAFAVAREHGFRAGPQLRAAPELLPRLVQLSLAHGIEEDFAHDLVVRMRLRAPAGADHRWPWPVRILVLGGWQVEVDGAPLPSSRKQSRRLLELLRLLAAHGAQGLAQERVADALWPDTDGDAARNALDNLLHRLRKVLGGDEHVLLRHGVLALNGQTCWIDADALQRRATGCAQVGTADLPGTLSGLLDLYRGPLLPDDPLPLVVLRRQAVLRHLQAALRDAVARLERAGLTDEAESARRRWTERLMQGEPHLPPGGHGPQ